MIEVQARRAVATDAEELVRLRAVMFESIDGAPPEPGEWTRETARSLREQLPGPDARMAAFVVDRPDGPGRLAACAVGIIDTRLGRPSNPSGRSGYILNVATEDAYRRRGYSRACMTSLLGWFRERGITGAQLHASEQGYDLYRQLGFRDVDSTSMRINFTG